MTLYYVVFFWKVEGFIPLWKNSLSLTSLVRPPTREFTVKTCHIVAYFLILKPCIFRGKWKHRFSLQWRFCLLVLTVLFCWIYGSLTTENKSYGNSLIIEAVYCNILLFSILLFLGGGTKMVVYKIVCAYEQDTKFLYFLNLVSGF